MTDISGCLALHNAFAGYHGDRETLRDSLQAMLMLRNRIMHHEPIHHRHLEADHAKIYRLLGYIEPEAASWLRGFDRVPRSWPCAHEEVTNLSDSASRPAESGRIWRSFDRFRGAVDASTWAVMALILIFVRAQDEVAWEAARSSPAPDVNELLLDLPPEISGNAGTALRTLRDLPVSALTDMIDAVESTARRFGNKAAFSHLLGEFAEHERKHGGTFYTPKSVTAILVKSLDMNSTSVVYVRSAVQVNS